MPDLAHLLALRRFAAGVYDSFAGWGDWRQQGDRMVSPSGKRSLTLEAFRRLKGRAPKAKPAGPKPKAAPKGTPKGQPKPGEAERYAAAKAKIARDAATAAERTGVRGPELDALRQRADAAEAQLKAGVKPSPTLPLTSLPKVPDQPPAQLSRTPGAGAPPAGRKLDTSAGAKPKAVVADPNPVLRRTPAPVIARTDTNRAGLAGAKLRATAGTAPPVPPKADDTPDLPALRKAVDDGVTTSRAQNWGYDFTRARQVMKDAAAQIDGYGKRNPAKLVALAREVTGEKPKTPEDAAKALKAWVGETVALLSREPDGRGVSKNSERPGRVAWFAEVAPRMRGMRALAAALAA